MNANLKLWATALRGNWPDNSSATLITFNGQGIPAYSALGVGCEVFRRTTHTGSWKADGRFVLPSQHPRPTMPPEVLAWYGLTETPSLLGKPFTEAAEVLDPIT